MKSIITLAILLVSILAFEDPGQKKLAKMQNLLSKSEDGVIHLAPKEYNKMVVENPRPYDVVTIFTVKSGCA
jgi:hypothetical protein